MSESAKTKTKAKSGSNMLKILIVVILAMILVGGATFAGYYFANKNKPEADAATNVKIVTNTIDLNELAYFELGEFTVDLADQGSKRYLKAKVFLAYSNKNKKIAEELEANPTPLRSTVNSIIRDKKAEELIGSKGSEALAKQIMERLNTMLTEGQITNVYFDDFVVQ